MSCQCTKGENHSDLISPYNLCLLCADKHLSSIYSEYSKNGLENRSFIIGEFFLFLLHLNNDNFSNDSFLLFNKILHRNDQDINNSSFLDLIERLNTRISNKEEFSKNSKRFVFPDNFENVDNTYNPYIAETFISAAWRLTEECGYISVNRPVIVDFLIKSQLAIYSQDYELAKEVKDIRHTIQNREENSITSDNWKNILMKFSNKNNVTSLN